MNTSHFIMLPQYYSTFGGPIRLSFFKNLMNDYYEHHGIENSFHDYDHILVLINIHKFQMMLHLL